MRIIHSGTTTNGLTSRGGNIVELCMCFRGCCMIECGTYKIFCWGSSEE